MKKPLLNILSITTAGGLAILLLSFSFAALINTTALQDVLVAWVKVRTHRTLDITGDLNFSFLPRPALTLHKISLTSPDDFSTREFIYAEAAELQINLWPLLFKKLVLERCVLRGWSLTLTTDKLGRHNWETVAMTPKDAVASKSQTENQAMEMMLNRSVIEQLQLEQGRIVWQDMQPGTEIAFNNIALHMDRFALAQPVNLTLAWQVQAQAATWDFKSQVKLYLDENLLKLEELLVQASLASEDSATDSKATWQLNALEFDRKQHELKPAVLQIDSAPLQATLEFSGHGWPGQTAILGKLHVATFNLRDWLKLWQVKLTMPKNTDTYSRLGLYFDFHLKPNVFKLSNFNLQFDSSKITADAEVKDFVQPQLNFSVLLDHMDVDRYWQADSNSPPVLSVADLMQRMVPGFALINQLKPMAVNGKIVLQSLKMQPLEMQDLALELKSITGQLTVKQAQSSATKS